MSAAWDSALQIFDEEQPDESCLLRVSVGGHGKEDICCMSVSPDLNLIATGSCSGIVVVSFHTGLSHLCVVDMGLREQQIRTLSDGA